MSHPSGVPKSATPPSTRERQRWRATLSLKRLELRSGDVLSGFGPLALLGSSFGERGVPVGPQLSEGCRKFGERRSQSHGRRGIESELVVAAAFTKLG
jgi:hypothetical protein